MPPYRLRGEVEQAGCEVGALEEALRVLVVLGGSPLADVVQVDGELGGVERLAFAEVFAGLDHVEPRLELRHGSILSGPREAARVRVQYPDLEVAVGERSRLTPVADDQAR